LTEKKDRVLNGRAVKQLFPILERNRGTLGGPKVALARALSLLFKLEVASAF
jgi:hypothetical protein